MKREKGYGDTDLLGILLALCLGAVLVGSWITHVVVCLKTGSWGFLIAGAILFPIANIHGIGIWFGWF